MGHEHERTGEFEQTILQHIQGRNIQIIGRLVENEQVRRLQHQLGDQKSCLFTAGKSRYRKVELFGAEEEPLRPRGQMDRAALIDHSIP